MKTNSLKRIFQYKIDDTKNSLTDQAILDRAFMVFIGW